MDAAFGHAAHALVAARSSGKSPLEAVAAVVAALREKGYVLVTGAISKDVLAPNFIGAGEPGTNSALADVVPPDKPYSGGGCRAQHARARAAGTDLMELKRSYSTYVPPSSFVGVPSSVAGPACRCSIAENGCIDPSLCAEPHSLAAIPVLPRWSFETLELFPAACAGLAWSGWAHPAVFKLLGVCFTVGDFLALWERSDKALRHPNERVRVTKSYTSSDGVDVWHFTHVTGDLKRKEPGVEKVITALRRLPPTSRIGMDPSFAPSAPPAGAFYPPTVQGGNCWKKAFPELCVPDLLFSEFQAYAAEYERRTAPYGLDTWYRIYSISTGDLHLEEFLETSPWVTSGRPEGEGWYSAAELQLLDIPDVYIAGAEKEVEESRRVNGVELAKGKAAIQFEDDYNTMKKTRFRMTSQEQVLYARWTGEPVYPTCAKRGTLDHVAMAVAREQLDLTLDSEYAHNKDGVKALWVGASATEIGRWWQHPGHDFQLALRDDKDAQRVIKRLRELLKYKLNDMYLPALRTQVGQTVELRLDGVKDALSFLQSGRRERVVLGQVSGRYDHLFFRDSLYDVTASQFSDYWLDTGAISGSAVLFAPDALWTEDAVPSEVYNYYEYYDVAEQVDDLISEIWPMVLVATPLLPLAQITELGHKILRWALTTGWEITKEALSNVLHDKYPFELVTGVAFDLLKVGPILNQAWSHIARLLRKYLARVSVTWKYGASNGYDHKRRWWHHWVTERRHPLVRDGRVYGFVDVEVVQREGEMWLLQFYKSAATSPIAYELSLPACRRAVHILDFERGWCLKTGTLQKAYYKKVSEEDWWSVFGFCLGEPLESLNYSVVMTQIARRMHGLKLGTNVLVNPMSLEWRSFVSFAMANLLEACRMDQVLSAIESNEENRAAHESNAKYLGKLLGKAGITVLTLGLAIPAWSLYKWLIERNPTIEFVRYPSEARRKILRPKPSVARTSTRAVLSQPFSLVLTTKAEKRGTVCELCSMQASGLFSMDGNPATGQEFICEPASEVNEHNIGFPASEVQQLITKLREGYMSHQAMNATKILSHIKSLQDWVEAQPNGFKHVVQIHNIYGAGGTGKTEVIKAMMLRFTSQGYDVASVMPFSKLLEEYKNASVLGHSEKVDFAAETTWYLPKRKKVDILFVDECSATEWHVVRAAAAFLGVRRMYLCGDAKQTMLAPERGEGISFTHAAAGVNVKAVPCHELRKQFRFKGFRARWANQRYGYRMVPVVDGDDRPRVMTRAAYADYVREHGPVEAELVFTHNAARAVFGKESAAGDPTLDNMSVRASQGKTYKTAAIAFLQGCEAVKDAHGMLNVANTRSRESPIYVVDNLEDPHVLRLREDLGIGSAEAAAAVLALPLPEKPAPAEDLTLTPEEARVNDLVLAHQRVGQVSPLRPEDALEECTVEVKGPKFVSDVAGAVAFYESIFQTCLTSCVREQFPDCEGMLAEFYRDAYAELLADKPSKLGGALKACFGLSDKGKRYLPLPWAVKALEARCDVLIAQDGAVIYVTPEREVRQFPLLCLELDPKRRHVTSWKQRSVRLPSGDEYRVGDLHPDTGRVLARSYVGGRLKAVESPATDVVPDVLVGSFRRFRKPDLPRSDLLQLESSMAAFSSWVYDPPDPRLRFVATRQKERAGTDGYKLAGVLDPSGAELFQPALNVVSAHLGVTRPVNIKLNLQTWEWSKTKAGKLRRRPVRSYYSQFPGMGNHFGDSPEETLLASQRLGAVLDRPKLTREAEAFAKLLARNYFKEVWSPKFFANPEFFNGVVERAMRDAKTRNYHGRAAAELAAQGSFSLQRLRIVVNNKAQFKPIKSGDLKLDKGGQPISQHPAWVNLNYMTWMRTHYAMQKCAANADVFFDDFEDNISFRHRVTQSIRALPSGARYAIADGVEWDSQQNLVTQAYEAELKRLCGSADSTIASWFLTRGDLPFIAYGLFTGRTGGSKPSGALDTKGANSDVQGGLAHHIFSGKGDKVVAVKGDDYLRCQVGLEMDQGAIRDIRTYMGMKIDCKIADGGEFCGTSVSRAGMFPSIVRAALKTLARPASTVEKFQETQAALRDFVSEVVQTGVEQVIGYSAYAEGRTVEVVRAYWTYLNSMAHISADQYLGSVRRRTAHRGRLPGVFGPRLW